jgi:N-methylhydantoinase B/oxoprolinase/acetone carboxylase alpha subunit
MTKKPNHPLEAGGSVAFFTAGGGGYGLPEERSRELVERDQSLGYVPARTESAERIRGSDPAA